MAACQLLVQDVGCRRAENFIKGPVFPFYFLGVGFPILTIFLAICSILELEAAMSTALAAFLSQNLSFRTVHGTW